MLTKEERAAIAERLHECDYLYDNALYQILFGHNVPSDTSFEDDSKAILERLADLIDPTCTADIKREDDGIDAQPYYTSSCGNCGALWDTITEAALLPKYCPHCGARVVQDD